MWEFNNTYKINTLKLTNAKVKFVHQIKLILTAPEIIRDHFFK